MSILLPFPAYSTPRQLSNGRIELTVDATIARIVRLARAGGENLIWMDPTPPLRSGEWINWGGDKLWWGPQIDWAAALDQPWPPDKALDADWQFLSAGPHRLLLQSGLSHAIGIRAQREITLSVDAPEVTIKNSFTREVASPQRVQLWTITQLRHPLWCWLESRPGSREQPFVNLRPQLDPSSFVRAEPEIGCVRITPSAKDTFMVGSRGRWLAAIYPDVIVAQQVTPSPDGEYPEKVSLQLFSNANYVELETLSGLHTPAVGDTVANTVRWLILDRPDNLNDAELSNWIREKLFAAPPSR